MRALIILAITGAGLVASMRSRFAGLLLYLWFAFGRPQEWVWGSLDTLRLSLVIGVAFVVPSIATGVWPDVKHRLSQLVLLLLCVGLLAQNEATYRADGWNALDQLSRNMIVALLAVTLITDQRRFLAAVTVVAGSLAFHTSKIGVGFIARGGARLADARIGGMFGDNNDVGLAAARVLFLLILCYQLHKSRIVRLGAAASIPFTICCILATFSRGAFLALVCGSVTYALAGKRKVRAVALLAGVGLAVSMAGVIRPEYADRIRTIWTYDTAEFSVGVEGYKIGDDSAIGRLHYWDIARRMAAARTFGVGLKNFEGSYNRFDFTDGLYGRSRSTHSSYFQILAETGYFGFAVWIALLLMGLIVVLRVRARSQRPEMPPESAHFFFVASNAVLASMVAFIIGGAFLAQAYNDLNWITFAFAASLDRLSTQAVAAGRADRKIAA